MSNKMFEIWNKHGVTFLVILAIILSSFVAFRAGQSHQRHTAASQIKVSINPLAAANPAQEEIKTLGDALARNGINVNDIASQEASTAELKPVIANNLQQSCALIGSKNSDKYHLPNCDSAKKIKPDNIVCFTSEEDAKNKGYQAAKCCH